uniref:Uncharacterized protein n=1 Tax=Noctiluca scintillans TaxID=2966 RepID=A0A7S1AVZ3_NOCSC|mmetsp:Transcript_6267/g.17477  ORF Transcript_6267/g.17477 Transcript_6267/m.17477 type:complete len:113 (+) Transcript_6267:89-427(+)
MGNSCASDCESVSQVCPARPRRPRNNQVAAFSQHPLEELTARDMEVSSLDELEQKRVNKWGSLPVSQVIAKGGLYEGIRELWELKKQEVDIRTGAYYDSSTTAICVVGDPDD